MTVEWSELETGQAETLLAVLLYNEHPQTTRVRPSRGDYGIDVLNPNDSAPETFDVYQIKYFPRSLTLGQKGQVEKSFRRLLIGLVRRRILVVCLGSAAVLNRLLSNMIQRAARPPTAGERRVDSSE
ncbi:hypothetical protein [Mycobacterium sp.]|uniref:hypothetical protein n=1 Tax=Mycobacterium sp. TaxID=1785 RepID=UPI003F9983F4